MTGELEWRGFFTSHSLTTTVHESFIAPPMLELGLNLELVQCNILHYMGMYYRSVAKL